MIGEEIMYFITCFQKIGNDKYGLDIGASRVMGYYSNFGSVNSVLQKNICDIQERIYHYAIVEEISEGVYPAVEERWFYKYDEENDGFYPIEEPKEFEHYSNIAFG